MAFQYNAKHDEPDNDGQIPLHFASASGNIDSINHLLNIDITTCNSRSKRGETPLDAACIAQKNEVISLLLPHTDLTMDDIHKDSLMLKAMQDCPPDIQKEFLKKGLQTYISLRQGHSSILAEAVSNFGLVFSEKDKVRTAKNLLDHLDDPENIPFNRTNLRVFANSKLRPLCNFFKIHEGALLNTSNLDNFTHTRDRQHNFKTQIKAIKEEDKEEQINDKNYPEFPGNV